MNRRALQQPSGVDSGQANASRAQSPTVGVTASYDFATPPRQPFDGFESTTSLDTPITSSAPPTNSLVQLTDSLSPDQVDAIATQQAKRVLQDCNAESARRFEQMQPKLRRHVREVQTVRADLQDVFQTIRRLKLKIGQRYPKVYEYVKTLHPAPAEADEE
ncbi:hypothetical protein H4R34_002766 [Dimargaris verticillata]|uniref:KxDL domain-containing protein n=1 Tax=Dimargaris verticillata TaxID=2761393 RepID=A0A9W8B1Z5_9FUNG|nr:hypothetical protein H4R34_002766 [Dimargaris verticillata]